MNRTSPIEARLAELFAAYADRAPVDIDAFVTARLVVETAARRRARFGVVSRTEGGLALVLLLVSLLVAIAAGAVVAGRQLSRDDVRILTEHGFVDPFIGLPPDGAVPSTPETGELVFSFGGRVRSIGMDFHRMWVYADGRLIWKSNLEGDRRNAWWSIGQSEPTTAVIEQHLTPYGVDLMRSAALATARVVGPAPRDSGAGGPGVLWGWMTVTGGARLLDATWSDPELPGRLANPASWLPATAWTDQRIGSYVPTHYAVCLWPGDRASTIDRVPEPARTLILANGTEIAASGEPTPDCLQVTTDVAREIASALDATGLDHVQLDVGLGYRDRNQAADSPDTIRLLPIVPHGEVVCSCG